MLGDTRNDCLCSVNGSSGVVVIRMLAKMLVLGFVVLQEKC